MSEKDGVFTPEVLDRVRMALAEIGHIPVVFDDPDVGRVAVYSPAPPVEDLEKAHLVAGAPAVFGRPLGDEELYMTLDGMADDESWRSYLERTGNIPLRLA